MEPVTLVALTGVRAGDGLKRAGAVFSASAEIAAELLEAGAARPADPEAPEEDAGSEPGADASQDARTKRTAG